MENKEKLRDEAELTEEECIVVLENLRERTKTYESMFRFYPKDYLERLADQDRAALDKAISILKSRAK